MIPEQSRYEFSAIGSDPMEFATDPGPCIGGVVHATYPDGLPNTFGKVVVVVSSVSGGSTWISLYGPRAAVRDYLERIGPKFTACRFRTDGGAA